MTSRRRFMTLAGAAVTVPAIFGGFVAAKKSSVTNFPLESGIVSVDLNGETLTTWGYNGSVPGPQIRVTEGETLRVPINNVLPEETLIHWHGISISNPMDGTRLTQNPIAPNEKFNYKFVVPEAGTHWYHSHVGAQADYGLYGPLIVEPCHETLVYDREYVLVLDDWSHGVTRDISVTGGANANAASARVGGYGRFSGGSTLSWDDIPPMILFGGRAYPYILVNGKAPSDPAVFDVKQGERARLRIINVAADTAFRFAVSGHRLTVTHCDGMPVEPVTIDTVRIGMAERYDVIIEANSPQIAQIGIAPEGKNGFGRALLRYIDATASSSPPSDLRPVELGRRLLHYDDLILARPAKVHSSSRPDRIFNMVLRDTDVEIEGMTKDDPIVVSEGEIIRFNFRNVSSKWHPMHLHGHHFHLVNTGRALKDTVIIPSGQVVSCEWKADNPGKWLMHCHNLYHNKDGMMRVIYYEDFLSDFYNLPPWINIDDLCR